MQSFDVKIGVYFGNGKQKHKNNPPKEKYLQKCFPKEIYYPPKGVFFCNEN